jgi:hypothetical protein
VHTYLTARLMTLTQARERWQTTQRALAEQKRTAEDVLQQLEGALAELQAALQQPAEEPPRDADVVLH